MLQRCARRFAVILENKNVFKPPVLFQIEDAVPESPQNIFNPFGRQRGETGIVIGRFNDDFMRPDSVHAVEHALRLPVEVSLNA